MPPVLTIIRWRDIPAQVTAKDGRRSAKHVLHRRFQVAIDKAAMKAGKRTASEYIGEWVSTRRPCSDDLEGEVRAVAERLEAEHTKDVLARLIEQGGWADPAAHEQDIADPATGNTSIEPSTNASPAAPSPEENA